MTVSLSLSLSLSHTHTHTKSLALGKEPLVPLGGGCIFIIREKKEQLFLQQTIMSYLVQSFIFPLTRNESELFISTLLYRDHKKVVIVPSGHSATVNRCYP